jgi:hypothetical protein
VLRAWGNLDMARAVQQRPSAHNDTAGRPTSRAHTEPWGGPPFGGRAAPLRPAVFAGGPPPPITVRLPQAGASLRPSGSARPARHHRRRRLVDRRRAATPPRMRAQTALVRVALRHEQAARATWKLAGRGVACLQVSASRAATRTSPSQRS